MWFGLQRRLNKLAQSISVIADIAINVIRARSRSKAVFTLNRQSFTLKTQGIVIQSTHSTRSKYPCQYQKIW
jgi:hypothetical protein